MTDFKQTLVVFDVDGTLVQSVGWDDHFFTQAIEEVLGASAVSTDWSSYRYQTDSALVLEIGGRGTGSQTVAQVREHFLKLLNANSSERGFQLQEVSGANRLLDVLHNTDEYAVAIATGGWGASAKLKLELAGIDTSDQPFASGDDCLARENIIQTAVRRAERLSGKTFPNVIYVGDGEWDLRATQNLGIGFCGVGEAMLQRKAMLQRAAPNRAEPNVTEISAVLDFSDTTSMLDMFSRIGRSNEGSVPHGVIRLAETVGDIERCRTLFTEYAQSLNIDLCFQDFETELAELPGKFGTPDGRLFLTFAADHQPAGCVAYRQLDNDVCEMKRLWVRPSYRRQGLGRKLASHVVDEARSFGYRRILLDSLRSLTAATELYRSLGFRETEAYTYNPIDDAIYMELQL